MNHGMLTSMGVGLRRIGVAARMSGGAALCAALLISIGELVYPVTPWTETLADTSMKIAYCGLLISLYCLVGSILGAAMGALFAALYIHTDLSNFARALLRWWRRGLDEDPLLLRRKFLGHAVATTTVFVGWLGAAGYVGHYAQVNFHHRGLIAALSIAVSLGLVVAAVVGELILARSLEVILRWFGRFRLIQRLISVPLALLSVVIILSLAVGLLIHFSEETVQALELGPILLALLFVLLTGVFIYPLTLLRRVGRWPQRRWPRHLAPIVLLAGFLAGIVFLGDMARPRAALVASSSLGMPMATSFRKLFDFDGDGKSGILGGGDCNDFDSRIVPGAFDWPEDGVDQNCLAGDSMIQDPEPQPFHPVPESVPEDLNIVLISVDALRADHLRCYGYKRRTSTRLDRLAREGILFRAGYSNCSATRCAIPSLITGRLPFSIDFPDNNSRTLEALSPSNRTISEILGKRGYFSAVLGAQSYFDESHGLIQGFDYVDNKLANSFKRGRGIQAKKLTDRVIGVLEKRVRDRRFFLWVHYMDPHHEYMAVPGHDFGSSKIDRYDSEVSHTDHNIGRIFDSLRGLGLWERTIVVVTGDHGEALGDHGQRWHDHRLYEPLVHVPLIAHVPGLEPRVVDEPVAHVDVLPTLLNLIRGEQLDGLQGRSALDLMTGDGEPRRVFMELASRRRTIYAIVSRRWKLIYNETTDTFELYDRLADPEESNNLVDVEHEVFEELLQPLAQRIEGALLNRESVKQLRLSVTDQAPDIPNKLDARFGSQIRLLGYEFHPQTVKRGDKLQLTLFFESLERLPGSHKIFVHYHWPGRKQFSNLDHVPVKDLFPIRYWTPGQYIRDQIDATTPKNARPGKLKIDIGVYSQGKRLELHGTAESKAANAVRISPIDVVQ